MVLIFYLAPAPTCAHTPLVDETGAVREPARREIERSVYKARELRDRAAPGSIPEMERSGTDFTLSRSQVSRCKSWL